MLAWPVVTLDLPREVITFRLKEQESLFIVHLLFWLSIHENSEASVPVIAENEEENCSALGRMAKISGRNAEFFRKDPAEIIGIIRFFFEANLNLLVLGPASAWYQRYLPWRIVFFMWGYCGNVPMRFGIGAKQGK